MTPTPPPPGAPAPAPAPAPTAAQRRAPRLWPLWCLLALAAVAILSIRFNAATPFQDRNIRSVAAGLGTSILVLFWWLFFSRVPWARRWLGLAGAIGLLAVLGSLFRVRGVSGDLLPIWEPRWRSRPTIPLSPVAPSDTIKLAPPATADSQKSQPENGRSSLATDFSQYLGPTRDTVVAGVKLDPDWTSRAPQVQWRIPVGSAWSGLVLVGEMVLTQEQRGEEELVTCRSLADGKLLWAHGDLAKYATMIAGAGPRQTPVVVENRIYTLGATGLLNCLELTTGKRLWETNIMAWANQSRPDGNPGRRLSVPDWGYSGTPLVAGDKVIVQAGGDAGRSLVAFDARTGAVVWSAGDGLIDYSSPTLLNLSGVPQVLIFSSQRISSHELSTGKILWQRAFGTKFPLVANPLAVGTNAVLLSAGYGVGAELLETTLADATEWTVASRWKSVRLKAKFHHPVRIGNYAYGLDDGIWACLNLQDGTQPWKAGRYGHGQGLLVGEHYLLMAESGELVLLRPTPEAPNELARFRVFDRKTWNPIALSGDRLLVRNDEEAVLLKLALK